MICFSIANAVGSKCNELHVFDKLNGVRQWNTKKRRKCSMRHQRAIAEKGREKKQNIVNCTLKITRNETNNYIGISCIINSIRRKQTTNSIENNHKTVLFFFVSFRAARTSYIALWCTHNHKCNGRAHVTHNVQSVHTQVNRLSFKNLIPFCCFTCFIFFLFRFRRNARLLHVFDGNKFVLSLFFFDRRLTHRRRLS